MAARPAVDLLAVGISKANRPRAAGTHMHEPSQEAHDANNIVSTNKEEQRGREDRDHVQRQAVECNLRKLHGCE